MSDFGKYIFLSLSSLSTSFSLSLHHISHLLSLLIFPFYLKKAVLYIFPSNNRERGLFTSANTNHLSTLKREKKFKRKTFFSSSLLWPKMANLSSADSVVSPFESHLRVWNTSSSGTFSCKEIKRKKCNQKINKIKKKKIQTETETSNKIFKILGPDSNKKNYQ